MRSQDVCAHALLVAQGDFFLYSGTLWYRAEPEDYAGPDSPRSEWTWPGRDPGGRRHSRTQRSRSPRVTRHGSARLAAYILEWPEGFEPITFRQFTTIPVPVRRNICTAEPWGGITSLPCDLGKVFTLSQLCSLRGGANLQHAKFQRNNWCFKEKLHSVSLKTSK